MAVPFLEAAQCRNHQARVGRRGLEGFGVPLVQRGLYGCLVIGAAQQAHHAVAVVREIGMQAHPAAVAAAVDAGQLVPQFGRGAAVDAQVAFAAEFGDGMAHVDADVLPAAGAAVPQCGGCQRRGAKAGLGGGAHGKARRQHRLGAVQLQVRQRLGGQAGIAPQRGNDFRGLKRHWRRIGLGVHGHSCSDGPKPATAGRHASMLLRHITFVAARRVRAGANPGDGRKSAAARGVRRLRHGKIPLLAFRHAI